MDGKCTCGEITYRLTDKPLFTHCCHCRWCQRETGSAFALNAMIEAECVELRSGVPEVINTPSQSGLGQQISRCPTCRVALWSVYVGAGDKFSFVRVGTLDDPDTCPPDIHIFTDSKQSWVVLAEGIPARLRYYDRKDFWPAASLARRSKVLGQ